MIALYAFGWAPPFAQGLVRDLRVRWALEEAGLPYQVRSIGLDDVNLPDYRRMQPFGQVPVLEEDGFALFESGAILLHIAERSEALLPRSADERARAIAWLFAALNTVEIAVQPLAEIDLFTPDEAWAKARRPQVEDFARRRLSELAAWLGERDHLEERFTVGDLMMTTVLQILRHTNLVASEPTLAAYVARNAARPAYGRALRDHMAAFEHKAA